MSDELSAFITDLESKEPASRIAAAQALAQMGERARPAAMALVDALRTADPTTREWCTAALEELGPPLPEQVDELIVLAGGDSLDAAYWAITLLGRAGEIAATAVDTLTTILRDSTETALRERAAWALGQLGPAARSAEPALREAAASQEPRLSRLAKESLEAIRR